MLPLQIKEGWRQERVGALGVGGALATDNKQTNSFRKTRLAKIVVEDAEEGSSRDQKTCSELVW